MPSEAAPNAHNYRYVHIISHYFVLLTHLSSWNRASKDIFINYVEIIINYVKVVSNYVERTLSCFAQRFTSVKST